VPKHIARLAAGQKIGKPPGRRVRLRIEGGAARVVTGASGELLSLQGIDERTQQVSLLLPGATARKLSVSPDREVPLSAFQA